MSSFLALIVLPLLLTGISDADGSSRNKRSTSSCKPIRAPVNGGIVFSDNIAIPFCEKGKFPSESWGALFFFVCQGNHWYSLTMKSLDMISGCTANAPGAGPLLYQYNGKCSDAKAQAEMKRQFMLYNLCPGGCSLNQLKVTCG